MVNNQETTPGVGNEAAFQHKFTRLYVLAQIIVLLFPTQSQT